MAGMVVFPYILGAVMSGGRDFNRPVFWGGMALAALAGLLAGLAVTAGRSSPAARLAAAAAAVVLSGWPPLAAGYWLQEGSLPPVVGWIAVPLTLAAVNAVILNVPSGGDTGAPKIMREPWGPGVFVALTALQWVFFSVSLTAGAPARTVFWYLPVSFASLVLAVMVLQRRHRAPAVLEVMAGLGTVIQLATVLGYLLTYRRLSP
jgi:hypothetical protein